MCVSVRAGMYARMHVKDKSTALSCKENEDML